MIEAAALGLFLPPSTHATEGPLPISTPPESESPSLHHLLVDSGVTVPTLLHHDPDKHILILSDLGRLPDLSQLFTDLGGFTPGYSKPVTTSPFSPKLGYPLDDQQVQRFRD